MWLPSCPCSLEEVMKGGANFARTFHIGEVPATVDCDQLSVRNCPRDVRGDFAREEIVIAPDN